MAIAATIDSVEAGAAGGLIGMMSCPGLGVFPILPEAIEARLAADFDRIRAFGPGALVTLMEAAELERAGLPPGRLAAQAEALALAWHHLPIRDLDVPDERFEARWTEAGALLRAELEDGGRILLHCRAGLGRTGMIAARLLVELGADPYDAIAQVRAARPGTIETPFQIEHVRRCRVREEPPG